MINKYPHMFAPLTIKGVTFKNRVMASPMTTDRTVWPDGTPTQECINGYETRARGGAAAVTVTETFIDFDRAARHDHSIDFVRPNPSVHKLESLFVLAEAIHTHGAVASVQFNHIGEINHPATIASGRNPIGPYGYVREDGVTIEQMDEAMMREVADEFAEACASAQSAGFEMVMLHGGHGWLLDQFTSPLTNHRTDEYGGSLENRAKFPLMVLDRVREVCGDKLIIEYRMSGSERVPGGLEIGEAAQFAAMIQDKVDIIHVTSGLYHNHVQSKAFSSMFHPHGCNLDLAEAIKKAVHIPVTAVGGFNSPQQIEDAIASGKCDFVAMGRQMLADPQFVNKTAEGREDEISPCLRCSCFNPLASDPDKIGKKVVMIGGGLIGVECSMHLADKYGCEVQVVEMMDDYARDAYMSHRQAIDLFMPKTVHIQCGVSCTEVRADGITVRDKEGNEIVYDADTVLYAIGMRAKTAEVHELLAAHPNTRIIGDCKKPAKILQAVRDGMMAAYDIV